MPALADKAPSTANGRTAPDEADGVETPAETEQKSERDPAADVTLTDYVVKPGQTLWNIADEILGDGNLYRTILQLNPSLNGNADTIHPGQIIKLP